MNKNIYPVFSRITINKLSSTSNKMFFFRLCFTSALSFKLSHTTNRDKMVD